MKYMKRICTTPLAMLIIAVLLATPAIAAVVQFHWDGEGGDNDWTTTANWDRTAPPYYPGNPYSNDHDVTIKDTSRRSTVYADVGVSVGRLLLGDGHTLVVDNPVQVYAEAQDELDGGLVIEGYVTVLEDDAEADQSVNCKYIYINFNNRTELVIESDDDDEEVTLYTTKT